MKLTGGGRFLLSHKQMLTHMKWLPGLVLLLPVQHQTCRQSCRCGSGRASLACETSLARTTATQRLARGCHTGCLRTATEHSASWALSLPPAVEDQLPGYGSAADADSGPGLHSGSIVTVYQSVAHNESHATSIAKIPVRLHNSYFQNILKCLVLFKKISSICIVQ